ncbi:hypothetical protein [Metabacillus indicus]|uniref:Uncharacterized protein n=1 Tax=Metabacillus indicus TaxID=246786 RepID=A0A084H1Y5_METID|nr:hypothetical protein [Metabacillus indicus]KEZ52400.1 hypothetical protein AZ46_0200990 [Metabacillus indicus LMG 22858]KEZ53597.1 hypothetical protein GS18_0200990 [Metabacillus indicus]
MGNGSAVLPFFNAFIKELWTKRLYTINQVLIENLEKWRHNCASDSGKSGGTKRHDASKLGFIFSTLT